jgi:NAD(P)-dependent dehydrogenase (short-subunit alcohol dehydrogenase family)
MTMLLKDKVALVTGAGRGIGRSVAIAYAKQGAKVVAVSRTEKELAKTQKAIRDLDGHVLALPMDIADDAKVTEMHDRILKDYGRLDVLVNNAAEMILQTVDEMTIKDWDYTLDINLRAPFILVKTFWEDMKSGGGGSIINVSSYSAVSGWRRETHYCASKWGLDGFTKALAVEAYPYNIAVNSIDTGKIKFKKTSWTDDYFATLPIEYQARFADGSVLAPAFIYLAMQDARGVTGRRLKADTLSIRIQHEGWKIKFEPIDFLRHEQQIGPQSVGLELDPAEL